MRNDEEYRAMRATIRERGTTRVWIFVVGILVWSVSAIATLMQQAPPAALLIPLLALAATFEGVLALHVAAERIGRYLLVFHDDDWERAAGAFGKPTGSIAVDPLFTVFFLLAALVTLMPLVAVAGLRTEELAGLGIAEAAFFVRVVAAKIACGRQRAVDTERFTYLKASDRDTTTTRH
jgi:hypothetical protein